MIGFTELALIIVTASVAGIIAKNLRQPLLIGYLFAGVILGLSGVLHIDESFEGLGQIGVTLLLFLVGMEMDLKELATIGKVALFTGIGQIFFTSTVGFIIIYLLGFGLLPSIYIAIALTFSSTIIIVKLLSEKNELDSLYGKIAVGFLLVQDFVAIAILMLLAGLQVGNVSVLSYLFIIVKGIALFFVVWQLSQKFLPRFFHKVVGDSSELVYVVSIGWALGFSLFVSDILGFSLEIGGFLAGLALSNLPEQSQVVSKTRPLRDFFLTIFFMVLGTKLLISGATSLIPHAILLSLFILIGNPLIVIFIMGMMGYKKRTSFLASVTVAQVSEFSLILMAMGAALGHVTESHVALVVLIGIITMTLSTYMILEANTIFGKIKNILSIFERKNTKEIINRKNEDLSDHIVIIGAGRAGKGIYPYFVKKKTPFVIVEFNPREVTRLVADRIPVLFGDISDPEILNLAKVDRAKLIISTIPDLHNNLSLLKHLGKKRRPYKIVKAQTKQDAVKLYERGATYVLVPEVITGEFVRHLLRTYGAEDKRIIKLGHSHFNRLIS